MKMTMKNENHYITTDLSLATTLSLSHSLLNVERIDSRRVAFVFESNDELQADIARYWEKKLQVEPQEYFSQLKQLKSRIYSQ